MELESAAVLRTGCATRQPRRQRGEEDCAARESSIFFDALRDRLGSEVARVTQDSLPRVAQSDPP